MLTCHSAHCDAIDPVTRFGPDVGETLDPVEIDQNLRLSQAHVQQRHETLTAREHLPVVTMLLQRSQRLGQ
jgi:hypothetical protein